MSETTTATEPTNKERAARIASILPAYIAAKEGGRMNPLALLDPDTLRDLICDALHYAREHGGEPGEIMGDAALNFSAEEEGAPVAPDEPAPMLRVFYACPTCDNKWEEEYESACDSECGKCGQKNIEANDWEEI